MIRLTEYAKIDDVAELAVAPVGNLTIVAMRDGKPAGGVPVSVSDPEGLTIASQFTLPNGTFSFVVPWGVPLKIYPGGISFYGDPKSPERRAMVTVYPGWNTELYGLGGLGTVPYGKLTVKVWDRINTRPAANVNVLVRTIQGATVGQGMTNEGGMILFHQVPMNTYIRVFPGNKTLRIPPSGHSVISLTWPS